jgi:hypothetical protein
MFVGLISFDHKEGSIVEYTNPSKEEIIQNNSDFLKFLIANSEKNYDKLDDIMNVIYNQLTYQCLPDNVHLKDENSQFFIIQNFCVPLFVTSAYKQDKTKQLDKDDLHNTRDYVQKVINNFILGYLHCFKNPVIRTLLFKNF